MMVIEKEIIKYKCEKCGEEWPTKERAILCEYDCEDSWKNVMKDGEEKEWECCNCDKKFIVSCSIDIRYHSIKCLKKFNKESKKHEGIDFDLKKKFKKAFQDIREGRISEFKGFDGGDK